MFDAEQARYIHPWDSYKGVEEHTAESVWQTCMCRSCQDCRESRGHEKGTAFRHKDEKY